MPPSCRSPGCRHAAARDARCRLTPSTLASCAVVIPSAYRAWASSRRNRFPSWVRVRTARETCSITVSRGRSGTVRAYDPGAWPVAPQGTQPHAETAWATRPRIRTTRNAPRTLRWPRRADTGPGPAGAQLKPRSSCAGDHRRTRGRPARTARVGRHPAGRRRHRLAASGGTASSLHPAAHSPSRLPPSQRGPGGQAQGETRNRVPVGSPSPADDPKAKPPVNDVDPAGSPPLPPARSNVQLGQPLLP